MKITAVKAALLRTGSIFIQITTSDGITGIGECSPMNGRVLQHFVETALAPLLIGEDPLDIDRLWHKMFHRTYKLGAQGVQPEAIAGIDIALWDILGKTTGLPIYQLLGGRYRDRITMYASIGGGADIEPGEMARRVEAALSQGFRAIKIRMDWGVARQDANPAKDLTMFRLCRQVCGPDIPLSFDVNNGYSVPTAIAQGRRFEDVGIYHFEEPVPQYDYAGLAQVAAALDVPVSAGEHEYTRWQFRDLIEQARVDIIQPDVVKCGGISEMRKIALLGEVYNRLFVPHQTQPTIGTAANLHLCATLIHCVRPQEYTGRRPELDDLFVEPLRFENGEIILPNGPGLGLELDEKKMEALRG
ncbi:MAG TPA: mandelate racemase/muconate lactonizing enzyme family protein [Armatimonadota bacterium]|nr:mandelate racemase/muconate lactonizing enzyme family protein [Armatimonadota bacterium]